MDVDNQRGFRYWFVAGLGLGAGLWVVTLFASILFFLAGGLADQISLSRITAGAKEAEAQVLEEVSKPQSPAPRVVRVPPGTVKECLQKTGGVVDTQYEVCRRGYRYKVNDSQGRP